jgi:hypothetical protein
MARSSKILGIPVVEKPGIMAAASEAGKRNNQNCILMLAARYDVPRRYDSERGDEGREVKK